MIARKAVVVKTKQRIFTNDKGENVKFFQVCAEDDKALYLLSARMDIPADTEIDIAYDGKKYSVIEYA